MANDSERCDVTRRDFVKVGVATAAVAGLPYALRADGPDDKKKEKKPKKPLPTRVLGRTGEKVSILNLGTAQQTSNRLFNAAWDAGIRYLDTADCYAGGNAEKKVGRWMAKKDKRKEIFLVTKDHPATPDEWVQTVDRRLAALQTDTIDLFFLHAIGGGSTSGVGGDEGHRDVPKMKQWAAAADKIKKSGKVKYVGFSTHTSLPLRTALLNNAVEGGWVDAIMLGYDPQIVREDKAFNKALDNCHKAGIGLISMKEMRGAKHAPKFLPKFEEMGLTTHQAVLHAVWSDERIASICSDMPNLRILKENTDAARTFKPMDKSTIGAVIGVYEQYASAYCNGCDGRCQRAGKTEAALGDIARCLSYYEMDGCRATARQAYSALTSIERDWHDADLAAASNACVSNLDFAALLPRAEDKLA